MFDALKLVIVKKTHTHTQNSNFENDRSPLRLKSKKKKKIISDELDHYYVLRCYRRATNKR